MRVWLAIFLFILSTISSALAYGECGHLDNGSLCANGLCCSEFGYCGSTAAYCCGKCQSQCNAAVCAPPPPPPPVTPSPPPPPPVPTPPPPEGGGIANLISKEMFNNFLKYKDDPRCHAVGFYTYEAFIEAANFFPEFGNTGDDETRKREIAAFLGQTSHETTGGPGWDAPDGPQFWGYCYKEEINKLVYCDNPTAECPCASGKMYYGRGPIQLTHNYNYCQAGKSTVINYNLLNDPDKVADDVLMSFKTALWFWMTEQLPKPSCHNVIIGNFTPSEADKAANRLPGYGLITNIINGGLECGIGYDERVDDRIKFYQRYCDVFEIGYGDNVDCYNQMHY